MSPGAGLLPGNLLLFSFDPFSCLTLASASLGNRPGPVGQTLLSTSLTLLNGTIGFFGLCSVPSLIFLQEHRFFLWEPIFCDLEGLICPILLRERFT